MSHEDDKKVTKEFRKYLERLEINGQSILEDEEWLARAEAIAEFLPPDILEDVNARLQKAVVQDEANFAEFAKAYALTAAETSLLKSLWKGQTVAQHSRDLGISTNTGRTHMQHLLDKTGANGQLDLVRLLREF